MLDYEESLRAYADQRRPTGDFLAAVLSNDLMDAVSRADEVNKYRLFDICSYVYNNIPACSHGSRKIVNEWLRGGQDDKVTND